MNIFTDLPTTIPDEFTETLLHAKQVRIERIVSHGHVSAEGFWFD